MRTFEEGMAAFAKLETIYRMTMMLRMLAKVGAAAFASMFCSLSTGHPPAWWQMLFFGHSFVSSFCWVLAICVPAAVLFVVVDELPKRAERYIRPEQRLKRRLDICAVATFAIPTLLFILALVVLPQEGKVFSARLLCMLMFTASAMVAVFVIILAVALHRYKEV